MPSPKLFDAQITFKTTLAQRCQIEAIQTIRSLPRLSDPIRDILRVAIPVYVATYLTAEEKERYEGVLAQTLKRYSLTAEILGEDKPKSKKKS